MAILKFQDALDHVLVFEGGYSDHPADPGGKTMAGVTQRVYDAFRARKKLSHRPVRGISKDEINQIYKQQYWDAIAADKLPSGIDVVVFDGAVNSGPKQAAKWLQRALGFSRSQVDGIIGNVTLAAVDKHPDHDALIARIIERREAFLKALKTFPTFGKGWMRRIKSVKETGQAWAMGSVGPAVEYIPGAEYKASVDDAKTPPSKSPGDLAAGGGGATTIGGGSLDQALNNAKDQLEPFVSIGFVKGIVVAIILVGVVVTVGGLAYRWWAARKAAQLADALDSDGATG